MILDIGQTYDCEVVKILSFGIVMKMEDGSTELVHISNISDKFVKDINDYVSVGDNCKVDCIAGSVKEKELSMKKYIDID